MRPPEKSRMFIRFVIQDKDTDSVRRQGLFQALSDLEDAGALYTHEQNLYDEVYAWFQQNLPVPRSFARSSKPHAKKVAISWFKDTATEHIRRMRELAHILEAHDRKVSVVTTERPGYVVYEDDYQIAAEPFRETIS
jgi:hypothetical protein